MKMHFLLGVFALCLDMQGLAARVSPAFMARSGRAEQQIQRRLPVFADSEDERVRSTLEEKIKELVDAKNFAGLDQLAMVLRRSKLETASGIWYLSTFYHILTYEWTETANLTESAWMERQTFLNRWAETLPVSVTAHVALARYWKNYAWNARGTNAANKVTEEAWGLYAERLKKSSQVLLKARRLRMKCPMWWDTMQFVALEQRLSLADYNAIFEEAVRFEASYTPFYNNKVMYLSPVWFGKEGDWQKFAAEQADKIGGEAGDILYARMGWRVHQRRYYTGFLRDAGYSWTRMKKGLQLIVEQHTESVTAASELAFLAYQADDHECAKPMFTRIGLLVDRSTWQDGMVRFVRARTWAMMD